MVKIENVTKHLDNKKVVDNISLTVERGSFFGLLGPNGAGKTTTINMIIGALSPDKGTIDIGGLGFPDRQAIKHLMGIVPQAVALYESLNAYDNLCFFGRLYGLYGRDLEERVQHVLQTVNLVERKNDRVSRYSEGMKRRLNIATALLHSPALLILDEPTAGVDPQSRYAIMESLKTLKADGCTIMITSHYIEEVQKLCDRVGIIDEGKLVVEDTLGKIISTYGGKSTVLAETQRGKIEIETDEPVKEIVRINEEEKIFSLQIESPNLEKAFLNITGKHLRD